MPWLLGSPSHQQQLFWLCSTNGSLLSMMQDFNHQCHLSLYKWYYKNMFLHFHGKAPFMMMKKHGYLGGWCIESVKAMKSEYGSDITQNDMGKIDHYQKYKKSANPIKMPPNMFKRNGHHFDKVDITGCKWKLSQWQLPAQPVIRCFGNLMTLTFQYIISSDIYVLLAFSCVNVAMVVNGLSITSFQCK